MSEHLRNGEGYGADGHLCSWWDVASPENDIAAVNGLLVTSRTVMSAGCNENNDRNDRKTYISSISFIH